MGEINRNDSCGDASIAKFLKSGDYSVSRVEESWSKYIVEEDLIILRLVADAKMYIAPCGKMMELFPAVAEKVNRKINFALEAMEKGIFDCYTRLEKGIQNK